MSIDVRRKMRSLRAIPALLVVAAGLAFMPGGLLAQAAAPALKRASMRNWAA